AVGPIVDDGLKLLSAEKPVQYRRDAHFPPPRGHKKGSSCFPGEGSLDFQEEVLRVAEAVGHALDHLDAVVHALENAGVHAELRTGQDASGVSAQVAGEAL